MRKGRERITQYRGRGKERRKGGKGGRGKRRKERKEGKKEGKGRSKKEGKGGREEKKRKQRTPQVKRNFFQRDWEER